MGCGATKIGAGSGEEWAPLPESDVDVASVKDFDVEQKEAEALRVESRENSAATPLSRYSEDPHQPAPPDALSLKSLQGELPPLAPPRRAKGEVIPTDTFFKDIDNLVQHTPSSASSSVTSLAIHLTSSSPSDLHSVRAIFCWLALNVSYDSESYLARARAATPQEPEFVLRCRQATCEGFARLCEVLCNLADIPCLTVHGFAKGYSHDPETVYSQASGAHHAWNLVLVAGEWRPLDCAWGAGYVGGDGTFRRQLNEFWFLPDPVEFLSTHFPYMYRNLASSRVYQLVLQPVDLPAFSSRVRLDRLAHSLGLRCVTHPHSVIQDVTNDVTVKLKTTKRRLKSVTAYLTEKCESEPTPTKERSGVLTSWDDDDTCRVYVRPPRAGTFLLTIMGQTAADSSDEERTTLQRVCLYAIHCVLAQPGNLQQAFPHLDGAWGIQYPMATECGLKKTTVTTNASVIDRQKKQEEPLLSPKDSTLPEDVKPHVHPPDASFLFRCHDQGAVGLVTVPLALCRHTEIAVRLRHADKMDDDLARYTFVEYGLAGADRVDILARLPFAGYYLLRVHAAHPSLPGLQHVADFLLHFAGHPPTSPQTPPQCLPFPRSSDFAHVQRTRLLEPLTREVFRGVTSLFRVRAPTLSRVRVDGLKMEQRASDGVWEAEVKPEHDGKSIVISGCVEREATQLSALYTFDVL